MSEEPKEKVKRVRTTPTHRWTEKQTSELLHKVLQQLQQHNAGFERPTSKVFYENVAKRSPYLRPLSWLVMKSKMRHIQTSYKAALHWYEKGGASQLDYYENETDHLNKICPFFDILKEIFGIVYDTNRAKVSQSFSSEIIKSTGGFVVLDTAAATPDNFAESSEMEMGSYEDSQEKYDFNGYGDEDDDVENVESDSHVSYDEEQQLKFAEIKWEKQLKALEVEKEKLRLARNNAEIQKKNARRSGAPYNRWTDTKTEEFLESVLAAIQNNSYLFEKPTAHVFYENIIAKNPIFEVLTWQIMKSKMRHLKAMYIKAVSYRSQMDATLTADKEQEVSAHILKICPHWSSLVKIFGQIDKNNWAQNFNDMTRSSYDEDSFSKDGGRSSPLSPITICKQEVLDGNNQGLITESNSAVSTTNRALHDMCNEALWDKEKPISSKPGDNDEDTEATTSKEILNKNLDISDAKWNKLMDLKMLNLQVEKEKIQLEHERLRCQFQLKKLELEHQIELRKLELKHEENITIAKQRLEMRKFELQLQLNRRL